MNLAKENGEKLRKYFPNLTLSFAKDCETVTEVNGTLSFGLSHYKKVKGRWTIEKSSQNNKNSFTGYYEIKIIMQRGYPVVFETSKKIKKLAQDLGIHYNDLHLNEDESCCVSIEAITQARDIYSFIRFSVYPYFAWQAYYERFQRVPPCGEYSHERAIAIEEFKDDIKRANPSDLCYCNSGKKIRNCHGLSKRGKNK